MNNRAQSAREIFATPLFLRNHTHLIAANGGNKQENVEKSVKLEFLSLQTGLLVRWGVLELAVSIEACMLLAGGGA